MRFSLLLVPLSTLSALAAPVSQPQATAAPVLATREVDQDPFPNKAADKLSAAFSTSNEAFQTLVDTISDRLPGFDTQENQFPSNILKRADAVDTTKATSATIYFFAPFDPTPFNKRADAASAHHHPDKATASAWTFMSSKSRGTLCEVLCKKGKCACRERGNGGGNSGKCRDQFFAENPYKNGGTGMFDD